MPFFPYNISSITPITAATQLVSQDNIAIPSNKNVNPKPYNYSLLSSFLGRILITELMPHDAFKAH